jgi:glutamate---cysteine ligase / carboxylate-amine ligase
MTSFAADSSLTVGLEEELLLVDPETLELAPVAGEVLSVMAADSKAASHEAYAAQIELRSPPSRAVLEATGTLRSLRSAAGAAGAVLMGAGVHPNARFGDVELVATDRYREVEESMRGLIRRTPESSLHVHVGMPDGEAAIRAFNGLRRHLPLLQGLSANSPWWYGMDSGLASGRWALTRPYPGRGIPRALRDFADWEVLAAVSVAAGGLKDASFLWWDIRLHPTYGTIEVREMDAQSSLEHVAALAALVRALACEAIEGTPQAGEPSEALNWSTFRAARDGVQATILDGGSLRPLAEIARATVARVRPVARSLGDEDALDGIEQILAEGGGAGRQRASCLRGGLGGMLRTLVDDTTPTPVAPMLEKRPA